GWMPHVGIAIATTVAGWVNAGLLVLTLARAGDYQADRRLVRNTWLILLASVVMGATLIAVLPLLAPYFAASAGLAHRASALVGLVAIGLAVYGLMILA